MSIPFNRPYIVGKELFYIAQAVTFGNLGGDGEFTRGCVRILRERLGLPQVLMTPSCTAALEMACLLAGLGPGDEVIMPSYTFVSTANAVVLRGATPVFVDIRPDTLNLDETLIEAAVTPRTRAVIPVHYAGVACAMDEIMALAARHRLLVIEDAAQAVNSYYKGRALGGIGDFGAYSFHETKNFICGEGGALVVNNAPYFDRAEIIRDKGTNRRRFFRGLVDKYSWVDVGSSYVPSEIASAFLYAQLEAFDTVTARRKEIFRIYQDSLRQLEVKGRLRLPRIPEVCDPNFHMFYVLMESEADRDGLMAHLKRAGIMAVIHYVPLHNSQFGRTVATTGPLPVTESASARLLRLPFYYDISREDQLKVIDAIYAYAEGQAVGLSRSA